jgi:hypothetical protein
VNVTVGGKTFRNVTMTEVRNATECGPRDDASAFRALSERKHMFQRNAAGNISEFGGHPFNGIRDDELRHLKGFPELKKVSLDGAAAFSDPSKPCITDAGLTHLSALTQLESLSIGYTPITDRGLMSLRQLSNLRYLSLHTTKVTDSGLEHLVELKGLRTLALSGTRVTRGGIAKLQVALTACNIHARNIS